jgi:hypothetical protein
MREAQEVLFKQMVEKRDKLLTEDNMNHLEAIFNQDILQGPDTDYV